MRLETHYIVYTETHFQISTKKIKILELYNEKAKIGLTEKNTNILLPKGVTRKTDSKYNWRHEEAKSIQCRVQDPGGR